jgi:hypothetical protein
VTREAGQAWAEPGAAGHDARDGNLTDSITITGTVDMNSTGTYLLTYTVADAAGNTATATRTVTVVDNRSGGPQRHRGDGYALGARRHLYHGQSDHGSG